MLVTSTTVARILAACAESYIDAVFTVLCRPSDPTSHAVQHCTSCSTPGGGGLRAFRHDRFRLVGVGQLLNEGAHAVGILQEWCQPRPEVAGVRAEDGIDQHLEYRAKREYVYFVFGM